MYYIIEHEIDRRFAYVVSRLDSFKSFKSDKEVISKVSKQIRDRNPPSRQTLRRWVIVFVNSKGDRNSLNPKHYLKGNRKIKFNGANKRSSKKRTIKDSFKINSIVNQMIKDHYKRFNISVRLLYQLIKHEIEEINKAFSQDKKLLIPHINSIYKRINKSKNTLFNRLFSEYFSVKVRIPRISISLYLSKHSNVSNNDVSIKNVPANDVLTKNNSVNEKIVLKQEFKTKHKLPKSMRHILIFLKEMHLTEKKTFICKHQKLLREKRQGFVNRSLYDIVMTYKNILERLAKS